MTNILTVDQCSLFLALFLVLQAFIRSICQIICTVSAFYHRADGESRYSAPDRFSNRVICSILNMKRNVLCHVHFSH